MRRLLLLIAVLIGPQPAHAVVGGAPAANDEASRAVVLVIGIRGNLCSGTLIAPTIVLTAAHCVHGNSTVRIRTADGKTPTATRIAAHPAFSSEAMARHRATADVALLQIAQPLSASPMRVGAPTSLTSGRAYRVVGSGLSQPRVEASVGVARSASLVATGSPGPLQLRLFDPVTKNQRAGLGACTGDSGGPVLEDQSGASVVVGVTAWSTGPGNAEGCGGLTGVTPLTLYKDWIVKTARAWGAPL